MRTQITVTLFILSILLTGCGKDKIVESDPPPAQGIPMNLTIYENLEGGNRIFEFHLATNEIFGCANFSILNEVLWRGYSVNIVIEGIDMPDICLTALGPATARIDLGNLTPGEHYFTLSNGESNTFKLIVTEEAYQIVPIELHNLTLNNQTLMRVPDNTIWGSVIYKQTDSLVAAQRFVASLEEVAQKMTLPEGDYRYFVIDQNGNIKTPENQGSEYVMPFIYRYQSDTLTIRNIVKDFGKQYDDDLTQMLASVYNEKGDFFLSWMLRRE